MLLKNIEDATGVDISNLATKRDFIALKLKLTRQILIKLLNDPTGLSNLKTKVGGLDIDKMKTVFVDLIKLNDIVSKEVVKKTVYNKLNTNVNN